MKVTVRSLVCAVVTVSLLGVGAIAHAEPPEAPTPERVGAPASIAVLGDSISQGTGSDGPGAPGGFIGSSRPAASWATGDHPGLDSLADRLAALRPDGTIQRFNLSANGANMVNNFADQAQTVPAGTEYVVAQMGGNDLCRPNVASMTPVELYEQELRAGLEWLAEHRSETLVTLYSIPDIYNLWYIRGAAHAGENFFNQGIAAGPRPTRTSAEASNAGNPTNFFGTPLFLSGARLLWNTLSVIPCQSLLANPTQPRNAGPTPDPNHPDEQRRLQVRARTIAFNNVLADVCAEYLRCRFDANATFDFSSNRGPDGVILANPADWGFVDTDISTQDHFHPSFAGQKKIAEVAFDSSFDFTDTIAPELTTSIDPPPTAAGWNNTAVTVNASATDDVGVRGLEYRVHLPDGSVGGWEPVLADTAEIAVTAEGVNYVEVRALDVNGNQSASEFITVQIDLTDPSVALVTPDDGDVYTLGEVVEAAYTCDDEPDGSGIATCEGDVDDGDAINTATVGAHTFAVVATDNAGNQTTVTVAYQVVYDFGGFGPPLDSDDPRAVRSGSTVPVRFDLSDHDGQPVATATAMYSIAPAGGGPALLTGGPFRYDADDEHYILPVSTAGLAPGDYLLTVHLDDGTDHAVGIIVR